jgi:hypothetical protein
MIEEAIHRGSMVREGASNLIMEFSSEKNKRFAEFMGFLKNNSELPLNGLIALKASLERIC